MVWTKRIFCIDGPGKGRVFEVKAKDAYIGPLWIDVKQYWEHDDDSREYEWAETCVLVNGEILPAYRALPRLPLQLHA